MRKHLIIAGAIAVTGLAVSALMPIKAAFAGDRLTIVSWGGTAQDAQREVWFKPFSKATGINITDASYNGEAAKIRAMVGSNAVTWDVVSGWSVWVNQLCAEGVLERIDWNRLGLDRSKFFDGDKYECGVPSLISASVIGYDKDRLSNGPKTIADFFDLKKFPGKRGLSKNPRASLEWALIADGVPIADVYKVLSTPEGVDRAFNKLDTIKKDIVWWTVGAQPTQLLANGEVVMTHAYNNRIHSANKDSGKHFEIMWDAAIWAAGTVWVIPKGGPRVDDAYKFIAFASSPQAQASITKYIPVGPCNMDAGAYIDPEVLPNLPTPERLANALQVSDSFWSDNGDRLNQRFTAWIAK